MSPDEVVVYWEAMILGSLGLLTKALSIGTLGRLGCRAWIDSTWLIRPAQDAAVVGLERR